MTDICGSKQLTASNTAALQRFQRLQSLHVSALEMQALIATCYDAALSCGCKLI